MFDRKYQGHDLEDLYEYFSVKDEDKYFKCKICNQKYIFFYSKNEYKLYYREHPYNKDFELLSCNEHIIKNLLE